VKKVRKNKRSTNERKKLRLETSKAKDDRRTTQRRLALKGGDYARNRTGRAD